MAYFSFLPESLSLSMKSNPVKFLWWTALMHSTIVHFCILSPSPRSKHTHTFDSQSTSLQIKQLCCVQLCGCVCVLLCSAACPCPTLIFIYHQVVMSFLYLFLNDPPFLCRGRRETFISLNLRQSQGTFPPPAHCH